MSQSPTGLAAIPAAGQPLAADVYLSRNELELMVQRAEPAGQKWAEIESLLVGPLPEHPN